MENNNKSTKECPICKTVYSKNLKQCPECLYREPIKLNHILWILIFILIPIIVLYSFSDGNVLNETKNTKKDTAFINIPIREMSNLSGLKKDEILSKRKEYVKNSIVFKDIKNYKPNLDVYRIEDELGWIGAYEIAVNGVKNNPNIAHGVSRHSISINNPELLMSIIIPDYNRDKYRQAFSEADYKLPQKIHFYKDKKMIITYFDISSYLKNRPQYSVDSIYLDETNARDLGFNWVYVSTLRNAAVQNKTNTITKAPYKMQGYYHRGFACGLKEGCNNYSPHQPDLIFKVTKGGKITFRLWKKRPLTASKKPDMTYVMIFK